MFFKKHCWIIPSLILLAGCQPTPEQAGVTTSPAAADFNLYFLQQTVADFPHWKEKYDASDSLRAAYGITHFKVAKILPDTGAIVVINRFTSLDQVKAFIASSALKNTMKDAGVTRLAGMDYIHVLRDDTSPMASPDRLLAKFTVNDFSKWVTAFDQAGIATEKGNGLLIRGLGRGLLDTTQAYLVLAVIDNRKTETYLQSENWKNFIQSSGTTDAPSLISYRFID